MKRTLTVVLAMIGWAATACISNAATVSISAVNPPLGRPTTPGQQGGGAPNSRIHEFIVTSDADILQIDQVVITAGGIYNVPAPEGGSNVEPPSALFETLVPKLGADTWISTPGATSIAGNDVDPFGTPNNSWFDTSSDGAVTSFMFARITTSGPGTFSGRVQVAGSAGPENFAFSFPINIIPEPASMGMMAAGALGLAAFRRRRVA
jgi:hypothetical protein